jgi:hypothetical protein
MAGKVVQVPSVQDLNGSLVALTPKKTLEYNFGDAMNRISFTEAFYNDPSGTRKLAFALTDVKSYKGIQLSKQSKKPSGYIMLSLTPEQSALIREKVDEVIFENIFTHRVTLIKDGRNIQDKLEIRRMYKGLVKPGDEKPDAPGTYWQDSVILGVPMKKDGPQVVVDSTLCEVTDMCGTDYGWSAMGGKMLDEVCVEIDRIRLDDTAFKLKATCRYIVVKDKAEPKFTSKRRLNTMQGDENVAKVPISTAPAAVISQVGSMAAPPSVPAPVNPSTAPSAEPPAAAGGGKRPRTTA